MQLALISVFPVLEYINLDLRLHNIACDLRGIIQQFNGLLGGER